jgi:hypothetical protein
LTSLSQDRSPPTRRPAFLITIDTEGDNLWARPREITTRNAEYLPRFQQLCERYGLVPTWLVNHEMAQCPIFRAFGREVLHRRAGEIGAHLHAWNSPPLVPLTEDDLRFQPYLIEYPEAVLRQKLWALTDTLEDTFGCRLRSHRAGRWALDGRYVRALVARGYVVDCSVTPGVSWRRVPGQLRRAGDCDYRRCSTRAYQPDLQDIGVPGESGLLEVPLTIRPRHRSRVASAVLSAIRGVPGRLLRRVLDRLFPTVIWLRPDGRNGRTLCALLDRVLEAGDEYAQFMLHSSELMPGGSPRFPTTRSVERLYEDLERLFAHAAGSFSGMTLGDFADRWTATHVSGPVKTMCGADG